MGWPFMCVGIQWQKEKEEMEELMGIKQSNIFGDEMTPPIHAGNSICTTTITIIAMDTTTINSRVMNIIGGLENDVQV